MRSFKIILLASFLGLLVVGCGIKKMVSRYPEVSVKLADENLENNLNSSDGFIYGYVAIGDTEDYTTFEIK